MFTTSRQQIEDELMQAVRQTQAEFGSATAFARHVAEQRFLKALWVFRNRWKTSRQTCGGAGASLRQFRGGFSASVPGENEWLVDKKMPNAVSEHVELKRFL